MLNRFLGILILLVVSYQSVAFERCIIGNDLPATKTVRVDWKNPTNQYDYFAQYCC